MSLTLSQCKVGKLRFHFECERPDNTPGTTGGQSINYKLDFMLWGDLIGLGGKELLTAQRIHSNSTHRIIARFNVRLDPSYRMKLRIKGMVTRMFSVDSVNDVEERRAYLDITVTEATT